MAAFFKKKINLVDNSKALAICILLSFSLSCLAAPLTATTAKTIQGSNPKFSNVLETEITLEQFSLFGFTYQGVDYYPSNIHSLSDFSALTSPAAIITNVIPIIQSPTIIQAFDDDGDGNMQVQAKTAITPKILDANNIDISANTASFCGLLDSNPGPYQLEFSGDLVLSTQYGAPRAQTYSVTEGVVGHQPKNSYPLPFTPTICYLQPNLNNNHGTPNASIWDPANGFLPQSDTQPEKNFPTTGFNNAWFNIKVSGFDVQTTGANWQAAVTSGSNILATVTTPSTNTIRVELAGPSTLLGIVPAFHGPALVEIKNDLNTLSYRFQINQWFINDYNNTYSDAELACGSSPANVRLPTRAELTNGTTLTRYTRTVGEGLFPEWGLLNYYSGANWAAYNYYWTSEEDMSDPGTHFGVLAQDGLVASIFDGYNHFFTTCINQ